MTALKFIFLMAQGGLVGYLAGQVFPGAGWEYWATILVNSGLVVAYGAALVAEENG